MVYTAWSSWKCQSCSYFLWSYSHLCCTQSSIWKSTHLKSLMIFWKSMIWCNPSGFGSHHHSQLLQKLWQMTSKIVVEPNTLLSLIPQLIWLLLRCSWIACDRRICICLPTNLMKHQLIPAARKEYLHCTLAYMVDLRHPMTNQNDRWSQIVLLKYDRCRNFDDHWRSIPRTCEQQAKGLTGYGKA